jgi:hypothetical protein
MAEERALYDASEEPWRVRSLRYKDKERMKRCEPIPLHPKQGKKFAEGQLNFRPGFTRFPAHLLTRMAEVEKGRRGAFLVHLLVWRESVGFENRTWTRPLSLEELSIRTGWPERTLKRILAADTGLLRKHHGGAARWGGWLGKAHQFMLSPDIPRSTKKDFVIIPNPFIDHLMGVLERFRRGSFLAFLVVWQQTWGRYRGFKEGQHPPEWVRLSGAELAAQMGWSKKSANRILQWLTETGVLERRDGDYRICSEIEEQVFREGFGTPEDESRLFELPARLRELFPSPIVAHLPPRGQRDAAAGLVGPPPGQ